MSLQNKLILRTLVSPFIGDITKNSVLSWSELDGDLLYLKGQLIYTATTSGSTILLHKMNGETIVYTGSTNSTTGDTYVINGNIINDNIVYVERNDGVEIPVIDFNHSTLVTPVARVHWEVRDSSNTLLTTSTDKILQVINGASISTIYNTSYSYDLNSGEFVSPDYISGEFSNIDPGENVDSSQLTLSNITSNNTYRVIFHKSGGGGYKVDLDGYVYPVPTTGETTTSDSISVRFYDEVFHGEVTNGSATTPPTPTETEVKAIINGGTLMNNGDFTIPNIASTPDSGGVYSHHYIAYPANRGIMNTIILDGATSVPILNVYSLTTISLTNSMGITGTYNVYTSKDSNPYDNTTVEFKH